MNEKTIVGLTGNIATGKSAIMLLASKRGATTIDADKVAHEVLHMSNTKDAIRTAFGDDVFDADDNIIRPALGRIVFADKARLHELEGITHPAIRAEIVRRMVEAESDVVVVEAIKLLEGPLKNYVAEIWVTTCKPETQVARLIEYRGMDEADARQRVAAQSPQADKIAQANVVFDTNGTMEDTIVQFEVAWANMTYNLT